MEMDLTERFLNYTRFDTQSSEESESVPSTPKQLLFARYLKEELEREGLEDVELDNQGYIYATLPANIKDKVPVVGFIAHYDTSPDCSGADVKPRIVNDYDGGDIVLSGDIVSSPKRFPELLQHIGEDLIVTDGMTLLGADDKAGIAEIVQAMVYLKQHKDIKHGKIRIAFNPDEEIGMGAQHFDVEKFGCEWGYTMDGGDVGELEFENFNAASAKIIIKGVSVHPGYAKGKMKNAMRIAIELNSLLPVEQKPEYTEGYEGFFHLIGFNGTVEEATISYIIRDHDMALYEHKKAVMQDCVDFINRKYGEGTATANIRHQYYNMRTQVEPHYHVVEKAIKAMEMEGIKPRIQPIRGGTDGANLSFMGLPCPNIFAGGLNFHGKMEFVPLESMEAASKVILNIIALYAE